MRFLWNIVSFLAVVHLLALLMFVGWLWRTDRLDSQRVRAVGRNEGHRRLRQHRFGEARARIGHLCRHGV